MQNPVTLTCSQSEVVDTFYEKFEKAYPNSTMSTWLDDVTLYKFLEYLKLVH